MVPEWIKHVLGWEGREPGDWLASHYLLAVQRPVGHKRRLFTPGGLLVHTTGRGVHTRAAEWGCSPTEAALRIYSRMRTGPQYVGAPDGTVYQLLPDNRVAWHAGRSRGERRRYLSGAWTEDVSPEALERWRARWPRHASPQHLFPTKSPNRWYVGVELVPLAASEVGPSGLWFTEAQHLAVAFLGSDLARRYDWPERWYEGPRLGAHGDVDAIHRWDAEGSWDVGALRDQPRFDWERVLSALRAG